MKDYYRPKDYYHILGVGRDAGLDEIKQSYRKLAKRYHPDKAGGDKGCEERFKEILEAYEILSNPARRREYDELRRRDVTDTIPAAPYSDRKKPVFRKPGRYAAYNRARKFSMLALILISIGIVLAILMLTAAPKPYSPLRNIEPYRPKIPSPAETEAVPAIPGGHKNNMAKDIQEEIGIIQDTVNQKFDDFEKGNAHHRPEEWEKKSLDKDVEQDIQWRLRWREKEKEMQQNYVDEWNRKQQEKDAGQVQ